MERDIFISYSRNDLDAVRRIKEEIEAATGKECWMDLNGIESGAVQFAKDIIKGIKDCKVFLFMLSESSQDSDFALRELNFAYNQARDCDKKVVIVNITGCKMSDEFAFMYGLTDTITWNNTPQHDKLIRDLKRWLGNDVGMSERVRPAAETKQDKVFDVKGVQFKMIYVQGGTFQMGATPEQGSDAYDDEKPVHNVTLSDFHIGETPVTQALWKAVMGSAPSRFEGENKPVEQVSWNFCQEFIRKLNALTEEKFRLPTEAEWEYAARGGNKSRGYKYAGSNNIGEVAWYKDNSGNMTQPVKSKLPNELGLYDMSGNVWEWCSDCFFRCYLGSRQANPQVFIEDSGRVLRGGGWCYDAKQCRVSRRFHDDPDSHFNDLGFRLALVHE